jgi:hypothetical protein
VLLTDVEEVRGRGETDAGRAVGGDGGGEGAHAEEDDTGSRGGGRRPERSCEEEDGVGSPEQSPDMIFFRAGESPTPLKSNGVHVNESLI